MKNKFVELHGKNPLIAILMEMGSKITIEGYLSLAGIDTPLSKEISANLIAEFPEWEKEIENLTEKEELNQSNPFTLPRPKKNPNHITQDPPYLKPGSFKRDQSRAGQISVRPYKMPSSETINSSPNRDKKIGKLNEPLKEEKETELSSLSDQEINSLAKQLVLLMKSQSKDPKSTSNDESNQT
jgi:hypothetical protein